MKRNIFENYLIAGLGAAFLGLKGCEAYNNNPIEKDIIPPPLKKLKEKHQRN